MYLLMGLISGFAVSEHRMMQLLGSAPCCHRLKGSSTMGKGMGAWKSLVK